MIARRFYLVVIASLSLLWGNAFPQSTIRKMPSGASSALVSIERQGSLLVSLPDLATQLGFRWQWDLYAERCTITGNRHTILITNDNPFCTVDGTVMQLRERPVRSGGSLYLPVEDCEELFAGVVPGSLGWNPGDRTLTWDSTARSITSVNVDQKENGTLVRIAMADSIPYQFSYFYPNLIFNFLGGEVDTGLVKYNNPAGLIDSVFGVQFKGSAQVSLILRKEVEEPQVDYEQATHTILISLRPKNQVKKIPLAVLNETVPDNQLRTIMIDPGHGGKDPGAIGVTGIKEKDVVLSIGLMLRDLLRKNTSINVCMTRESDIFIPLRDRTNMANQKKADLFISIHANAIPGSKDRQESTNGYKVYFLSQAKNEEDKLAAMRENEVIRLEEKPQNYDNLKNVLIDLAGNEYLRESQDLCISFDQEFSSSMKKIPRLQLGVGQANFWVLNGAYMPSVLIETGFLSNENEEKLLADKGFQKQMAHSMFEAILHFRKKFESGL